MGIKAKVELEFRTLDLPETVYTTGGQEFHWDDLPATAIEALLDAYAAAVWKKAGKNPPPSVLGG